MVARQISIDMSIDSDSWYSFFIRTWRGINSRCNAQYEGRVRVDLTQDEYRVWCESQKNRIEAIQRRARKPSQRASIDRIDPDGHYALSNIRVITLRENCKPTRLVWGEELSWTRG